MFLCLTHLCLYFQHVSVVSFQAENCPVTSELVKNQDVSSVRTSDPDSRSVLSTLNTASVALVLNNKNVCHLTLIYCVVIGAFHRSVGQLN